MNAGEQQAEDLPPGTPVVVYARLGGDPDAAADSFADLIRWCHRRQLALRGAYLDGPGGQPFDVAAGLRAAAAAVLVVPGVEHLGADPAAQIRRVAEAGAVVAVAPNWERLINGNRVSGTVFGSTIQAHYAPVRVIFQLPKVPPPPRLLPPPPTAAELPGETAARVADWLGALQPTRPNGPRIGVITGPAGSGKRRCALAYLHGQDHRDGELYADLGSELTDPVTPGSVLQRWLPALLGVGSPGERLEEQAVEYMGATADKRLGVLLTGAVSAAQVRPLIPNGPALMIVTSRRLLSGLALDGARFLHIDDDDGDGPEWD
jgi:hypothetical protein